VRAVRLDGIDLIRDDLALLDAHLALLGALPGGFPEHGGTSTP
jgi:hypothetical protein